MNSLLYLKLLWYKIWTNDVTSVKSDILGVESILLIYISELITVQKLIPSDLSGTLIKDGNYLLV